MALAIEKVDVWAGDIQDQSGGLADVLGPLAEAGADLECVIARRNPDRPGTGEVFVSPVTGKRVQDAARGAGLSPAQSLATLRVEGSDRAGVGQRLMRAIASEGINVRGVSAMKQGSRFVAYIGFDSIEDANRAGRAIKAVNGAANRSRTSGQRGTRARRPRAMARR